jgi:N6-L-threonylcarbamoyladenine synthase
VKLLEVRRHTEAYILQIPLVGVHHMQAHALTPRLVAALDASEHFSQAWEDAPHTTEGDISVAPNFPFLSVLASGGHTLLIHSATLTRHDVLGSTSDVAVGECLDKTARIVLPPKMLQEAGNTMYGALLEQFAFPPESNKSRRVSHSMHAVSPVPKAISEFRSAREFCQKFELHYEYRVPKNHEEELQRNVSKWGWAFNQPLSKAGGGSKNKSLEMSFSGLMTAVERAVRYQHDQSTGKLTKKERSSDDISLEERRDMAEFSMRAAFEHIAARVVLALQSTPATTIVVSGGVGANYYLRFVLASKLVAHGYGDVSVVFPPPNLCSDNAAMIAWTGAEMFRAGHRDKLSIRAIRKWPLDMLLSPPIERTT